MGKRGRSIAWLLSLIYFSQGAVGISGIALPLYLRSLNWTVGEVTTMMSASAIPWIFKIFYGLLSDSWPLFGYRRKSYLVVCLICAALGWMGLVILPPSKYWIFASLFLANMGFASIDVVTDGLTVEHSTATSSHIYQSISWGSRSVGSIVGGILGGLLAARWQPQQVFIVTMFLPLSIIWVVLSIRERKMPRSPFRSSLTPLKRCSKLLETKNIRAIMMILCLASISSFFGIPFFFHMKEVLGFRETFLGVLGSLGWFGAAIGSALYLYVLRRFPPRFTMTLAVVTYSLTILSTLLVFTERSAFVIVLLGGISGCLIMLPIMSMAAAMTHRSHVEGVMFAILMSIYNIGQIFFGFLGGKLVSFVGLYPLIFCAGIVILFNLFFIRQLNYKKR